MEMKFTRKVTLVVAAGNEGAFEDALAEATRLINQGNLSGSNSNDEGGFYFDSTDSVREGERPRI